MIHLIILIVRICSEQSKFVSVPLYNVSLIVFLNYKSLWIKVSAKLINVNVIICEKDQSQLSM